MADLIVGTRAGVIDLNGEAPTPDEAFGPRDATALFAAGGDAWAIARRRTIARRDASGAWTDLAELDVHDLTCVLPTPSGVFAGADGAHLLLLEDGSLRRVEAFEAIEGRDGWFTPWGGPPAVRSMAADLAGRLHVNVHVGGIPRSTDGAATWEPTIEIETDIHQVIAHPSEPDTILAAGAVGLVVSQDGGASWTIEADGLHSTYARAVAVAGETVLLSASNGPRGGRAAVYRVTLDGDRRFERCVDGLPEWFGANIDSGWLVADGSTVAFGTGDGDVFVSDDEGGRWRKAAGDLPTIRALCFV